MTEQRTRRDVWPIEEGLRLEERVLEHVDAVVFQVGALLPGELADAYPGVDAPCVRSLSLTSGKITSSCLRGRERDQ
jgi:hypothetical protein